IPRGELFHEAGKCAAKWIEIVRAQSSRRQSDKPRCHCLCCLPFCPMDRYRTSWTQRDVSRPRKTPSPESKSGAHRGQAGHPENRRAHRSPDSALTEIACLHWCSSRIHCGETRRSDCPEILLQRLEGCSLRAVCRELRQVGARWAIAQKNLFVVPPNLSCQPSL